MKKLGIICGYGFLGNNIDLIHTRNLINYYKLVVQKINSQLEEFEVLVLSGGFSNQTFWQSEAENMKDFFLSKLNLQKHNLAILCENTFIITYENLVFSFLTSRNFLSNVDTLVIFCDQYRKFKVQTQAEFLFKKHFKIEVNAFLREDDHPNSNYKIQTEIILPKEIQDPKFLAYKHLIDIILN
jgi:hypothetical protein